MRYAAIVAFMMLAFQPSDSHAFLGNVKKFFEKDVRKAFDPAYRRREERKARQRWLQRKRLKNKLQKGAVVAFEGHRSVPVGPQHRGKPGRRKKSKRMGMSSSAVYSSSRGRATINSRKQIEITNMSAALNNKNVTFNVYRQGEDFFFKSHPQSHGKGLYLQMAQNDKLQFLRSVGKEQKGWERFRIHGHAGACYIQSVQTGAYWSVRDPYPQAGLTKFHIRGSDSKFRKVTWRKSYERFKIKVLKEWWQKEAGQEAGVKSEGKPFAGTEVDKQGAKPTPKDVPGIKNKIPSGTLIALKSAGKHSTGKYLRIIDGDFITADGNSTRDPNCWAEVIWDGNWLILNYVMAKAKNLQVKPRSHMVIAANRNRKDREKFAVIGDSIKRVKLHSLGSGGFLRVPADTDMWAKSPRGAGKKHAMEKRKDIDDRDALLVTTKRDKLGHAAKRNSRGTVFEIEVIQPVDERFEAGGSSYIYSRAKEKSGVKFNSNWKFGVPGAGSVAFEARGLAGIHMKLASKMTDLKEVAIYKVAIGSRGNTVSKIMRHAPKSEKSEAKGVTINANDGGKKEAMMTGGWPLDGIEWNQFWVSWDEKTGKIAVGRGTEVGKKAFMEWQDAKAIKDIQYVAFGGHAFRVEYRNINFSKAPPPKPLVVPVGFKKAGSKVSKVAVGSKDGKMVVMALTLEKKLVKYVSENKWESVTTGVNEIDEIAVGDDGSVYFVSGKDIYKEKDTPLPRPFRGPIPPQPEEKTAAELKKEEAAASKPTRRRRVRRRRRRGRRRSRRGRRRVRRARRGQRRAIRGRRRARRSYQRMRDNEKTAKSDLDKALEAVKKTK